MAVGLHRGPIMTVFWFMRCSIRWQQFCTETKNKMGRQYCEEWHKCWLDLLIHSDEGCLANERMIVYQMTTAHGRTEDMRQNWKFEQ